MDGVPRVGDERELYNILESGFHSSFLDHSAGRLLGFVFPGASVSVYCDSEGNLFSIGTKMAADKIINHVEKQADGSSTFDRDNNKLRAAESIAALLRADKEKERLVFINLGLGYLSNKVQVQHKTSKGRGMYVKEGCTVQAGELILLENALGTVKGVDGEEDLRAAMSKVAAVEGLAGENITAVADKLYLCDIACDVQVEERCRHNQWGTSRGTALGRLTSLFNHSCLPNARESNLCCGTVLSVRATKAVGGGEELLVSYNILVEPESVRNQELRDRWNFTCDCERCVVERELPADIISKMSNLFVISNKVHNGENMGTYVREMLAAGGEALAQVILRSVSDTMSPRVTEFVRCSIAASRYRCGNREEVVACNTEWFPGCSSTFDVLKCIPELSGRYLDQNELVVYGPGIACSDASTKIVETSVNDHEETTQPSANDIEEITRTTSANDGKFKETLTQTSANPQRDKGIA